MLRAVLFFATVATGLCARPAVGLRGPAGKAGFRTASLVSSARSNISPMRMSGGGSTIQNIVSREVLDSRGNPTVEVDLTTDIGTFRAIVPSGEYRPRSFSLIRSCEKRDCGQEHLDRHMDGRNCDPGSFGTPLPLIRASLPTPHLSCHGRPIGAGIGGGCPPCRPFLARPPSPLVVPPHHGLRLAVCTPLTGGRLHLGSRPTSWRMNILRGSWGFRGCQPPSSTGP